MQIPQTYTMALLACADSLPRFAKPEPMIHGDCQITKCFAFVSQGLPTANAPKHRMRWFEYRLSVFDFGFRLFVNLFTLDQALRCCLKQVERQHQ